MKTIIKKYPGNLELSFGSETNADGQGGTITGITLHRIIERSKHPLGQRLSKILNKQFSKRNLVNINFVAGWDYDNGSGWQIEVEYK